MDTDVDSAAEKAALLETLKQYKVRTAPSQLPRFRGQCGVVATARILKDEAVFPCNGALSNRIIDLTYLEIMSLPRHSRILVFAFYQPNEDHRTTPREELTFPVPTNGLIHVGSAYFCNSAYGTDYEPNVATGRRIDGSGFAELVATRDIEVGAELLDTYPIWNDDDNEMSAASPNDIVDTIAEDEAEAKMIYDLRSHLASLQARVKQLEGMVTRNNGHLVGLKRRNKSLEIDRAILRTNSRLWVDKVNETFVQEKRQRTNYEGDYRCNPLIELDDSDDDESVAVDNNDDDEDGEPLLTIDQGAEGDVMILRALSLGDRMQYLMHNSTAAIQDKIEGEKELYASNIMQNNSAKGNGDSIAQSDNGEESILSAQPTNAASAAVKTRKQKRQQGREKERHRRRKTKAARKATLVHREMSHADGKRVLQGWERAAEVEKAAERGNNVGGTKTRTNCDDIAALTLCRILADSTNHVVSYTRVVAIRPEDAQRWQNGRFVVKVVFACDRTKSGVTSYKAQVDFFGEVLHSLMCTNNAGLLDEAVKERIWKEVGRAADSKTGAGDGHELSLRYRQSWIRFIKKTGIATAALEPQRQARTIETMDLDEC